MKKAEPVENNKIVKAIINIKKIKEQYNRPKSEIIELLKDIGADKYRTIDKPDLKVEYRIIGNEPYEIKVYQDKKYIIVEEKQIDIDEYMNKILETSTNYDKKL